MLHQTTRQLFTSGHQFSSQRLPLQLSSLLNLPAGPSCFPSSSPSFSSSSSSSYSFLFSPCPSSFARTSPACFSLIDLPSPKIPTVTLPHTALFQARRHHSQATRRSIAFAALGPSSSRFSSSLAFCSPWSPLSVPLQQQQKRFLASQGSSTETQKESKPEKQQQQQQQKQEEGQRATEGAEGEVIIYEAPWRRQTLVRFVLCFSVVQIFIGLGAGLYAVTSPEMQETAKAIVVPLASIGPVLLAYFVFIARKNIPVAITKAKNNPHTVQVSYYTLVGSEFTTSLPVADVVPRSSPLSPDDTQSAELLQLYFHARHPKTGNLTSRSMSLAFAGIKDRVLFSRLLAGLPLDDPKKTNWPDVIQQRKTARKAAN